MTARDGCIGAQLVVVSNAGDERSTLLNEQRELGRRAALEGDTGRVWFEWSAPDDADPYDEDVWRATIPTLEQPDGIGLEFVRMEAESMRLEDFRREYLCVHTARPVAHVIDPVVWARPARVTSSSRAPVSCSRSTPRRTARRPRWSPPAGLGDDDDAGVVAVEVRRAAPGAEWVAGYVADARRATITRPVVVDRTGRSATSSPSSSARRGAGARRQGRRGRRRRRRVLST